MENKFSAADALGDIVTSFPGASHLFKENRIDFCCGGDRTLGIVLQDHKLEEEPFIVKLNSLYTEATKANESNINWREMKSVDLIDYVVNAHHAYLLKELPAISEFVIKILRVHGMNHPELSKLHQLYHQMKMEFDQHLIDEEQKVFPLIAEYDWNPSAALKKQIAQEIVTLEDDHSGVGDLLREIRTLTNDYAMPADACNTYALTFRKLEDLESDTFQHVHLENNILFPRFS